MEPLAAAEGLQPMTCASQHNDSCRNVLYQGTGNGEKGRAFIKDKGQSPQKDKHTDQIYFTEKKGKYRPQKNETLKNQQVEIMSK